MESSSVERDLGVPSTEFNTSIMVTAFSEIHLANWISVKNYVAKTSILKPPLAKVPYLVKYPPLGMLVKYPPLGMLNLFLPLCLPSTYVKPGTA